MKKNIGTPDRLLRGTLALLLFGYAWYAGSWIALLVALFVLYEALASWCFLYQLLGKTSCEINKK